MSASVPYYAATVCLVLFAIGHNSAFRQSDPKWGIDELVRSMRSTPFQVLGFNRTYWDFFLAKGSTIAALYLFSAVLAWQLGSLPAAERAHLQLLLWAFALCFAAITFLNWRYLFTIPIAFAGSITLCLIAGAWLSTPH